MRFDRTLTPAGLLVTGALLLAACGGGTDTTAPVTTSPAAVDESAPAPPSEAAATEAVPTEVAASEPASSEPPSSEPPSSETASSETASSETASSAAPTGGAEAPAGATAGQATVVVDGGPTFDIPLGSCDTSATAPDIFLLEDSFQVSGENDTVSFSAAWLSADSEGYFGIGTLESVGGDGGIATFVPGDLTYSDGAVSGTTTFTVIGPDVMGVADGDTGTVTFAC